MLLQASHRSATDTQEFGERSQCEDLALGDVTGAEPAFAGGKFLRPVTLGAQAQGSLRAPAPARVSWVQPLGLPSFVPCSEIL